MEPTIRCLTLFHVIIGAIALSSGLVPMLSQKGGRLHKKAGMVYFWAMLAVCLTAMPIAIYRGNVFLFTIGIFSFYLVFTGYRFTKLKPKNQVSMLDRAVSVITLITGLSMLAVAFYFIQFIQKGNQGIALILALFGVLCFVFAYNDLKWQKNHTTDRHKWYFGHIVRMAASYIAAFTAFAVNTITFLPMLLVWLGPSLIGTTLIIYTTRKHRAKMGLK